jgi:Zn-dependent peptidase ImmA (M78 family)
VKTKQHRENAPLRELLNYAAERGIRVHVAHLPRPYRGYFDAAERVIVLDFTLTPIEQRVVLAHELGHAHFDHHCQDDPAAEAAADLFAAQLLIHPHDYAIAEQVTTDPDDLAEELGITPEILHLYQRECLTRLRGVTYARPRMGVGQFALRVVNA